MTKHIRIQSLLLLPALILVLALTGCLPDATNTETPNDMLVEPAAVQLTTANMSDTVGIRLVCGCPFSVVIDSVSGDTAAINYQLLKTGKLNSFQLKLSAAPGLSSGTYTATLHISSPDGSSTETFRKDVTATVVVP